MEPVLDMYLVWWWHHNNSYWRTLEIKTFIQHCLPCGLLFELSTCRSCLVSDLNQNSSDLHQLVTGTILYFSVWCEEFNLSHQFIHSQNSVFEVRTSDLFGDFVCFKGRGRGRQVGLFGDFGEVVSYYWLNIYPISNQ